MKRALIILFAGTLVLALSTALFAQAVPGGTPGREQSSEEKGTPANPDPRKATGEVTAIDAKAGTLTVKAEGKEMKLDATGAGAKKSLENIKIGDKVIVSYSTGPKGQLVAQSVERPGKERSKEGDRPGSR